MLQFKAPCEITRATHLPDDGHIFVVEERLHVADPLHTGAQGNARTQNLRQLSEVSSKGNQSIAGEDV